MTRSVTALADLLVPIGHRLGVRHFITELLDNPDSPENWIRVCNALYEHTKPPLLMDGWRPADPLVPDGAAGSFHVAAEYMLPASHVPTGLGDSAADQELVVGQVRYRMLNGATGRARIDIDNDTSGETADLTSASYAWASIDGAEFPSQAGDDALLCELKLKASGDSDNIEVTNLEARWGSARTELPAGPYDSTFRPFDLARFTDALKGLSVGTLRKLMTNLDDLKRRRTGGVVCTRSWGESGYAPGFVSAPPEGGDVQFWPMGYQVVRTLTRQFQGCDTVRFWIKGEPVTGDSTVRFLLRSDTGYSATHTVDVDTASAPEWQSFELSLPKHHGEIPALVDVTATLTLEEAVLTDGPAIYGVCGWWLPIEGSIS